MILLTNSTRLWLAGMALSLVIFFIVYFTVIKPGSDTANRVARTGLQQSQQVLNQARTAIRTGERGSHSGAPGAATDTARRTIHRTDALQACLSRAGTDASRVSACQVKLAR